MKKLESKALVPVRELVTLRDYKTKGDNNMKRAYKIAVVVIVVVIAIVMMAVSAVATGVGFRSWLFSDRQGKSSTTVTNVGVNNGTITNTIVNCGTLAYKVVKDTKTTDAADAAETAAVYTTGKSIDTESGKIYVGDDGYLYVPNTIVESTRMGVYFPGGYEYELNTYQAENYVRKYSPNAVIFFSYKSGFGAKEKKVAMTGELMAQVAEELQMEMHDVFVAGASNGAYTAMKMAAYFYTEYGVPVTKCLTLDAAMSWEYPARDMLTDEECDALAEAGTVLCLFEQKGTGLKTAEIKRLVDRQLPVLILECSNGDHETINVNGFRYGVFSWALDEIELNADEYNPVWLYPVEGFLA